MDHITIYSHLLFKKEKNSLESGAKLSSGELRRLIYSRQIFKHFFGYKTATLIAHDLRLLSKPFALTFLTWMFSKKAAFRKDLKGNVETINLFLLGSLFIKALKDFFKKRPLLKKIEKELAAAQLVLKNKKTPKLNRDGAAVYLRTDFLFGAEAGGSVAHTAGVLNQFNFFFKSPIFITSDRIPTVKPSIETHIISPDDRFWDIRDLPALNYNRTFLNKAKALLKEKDVAFIYQRYSVNQFSGLQIANDLNVPFILEFNGSELWVSRNWGGPLKYHSLTEKIETLNLKAADLIVVVSEPLKDELILKGISSKKILVNPNGVDVATYHPKISGEEVRKACKLGDEIVVGFIGSFGPWHGVEVLVNAFSELLNKFPSYRGKVKLMLIGSGERFFAVQKIIQNLGLEADSILTGTIPQEEGPKYLAACDILTSPQTPNADGTPFFGSPTKLFEYMAMGKAIIASNLDQLGVVIEDKKSGLLVKPGDAHELKIGIKTLIDDPDLRQSLGKTARSRAETLYSWKEHTKKIIEHLYQL